MRGDLVLTIEQQKIVEDNHNLIYWYANKANLNIDEYYGLLAMELCKTVMKYDETKGSLANLYKMRCDNLIKNEYRNNSRKPREVYGYNDERIHNDMNDVELKIDLENLIKSDKTGVLKLIADGYTQKEISKILGISQSTVSNVLKRVRKENVF